MKLRTQIDISPSTHRIEPGNEIILVGSCFAENIGAQLKNRQWKCHVNPLGITYNPHSLFRQLTGLINNQPISRDSWFQHQGLWKHSELHSIFNHSDLTQATDHYQKSFNEAREGLLHSKTWIITLGTAWVFRKKEDGVIVNNCHQQEGELFEKILLTSDQIDRDFQFFYDSVKKLDHSPQLIFTVSPVRHIRHGLTENQRSKSLLLTSIHSWVDHNVSLEYFPSYEMMIDDLRDYRFYQRDLIHPNEVAIEYIWNHFESTYMTSKAQEYNRKAMKLFLLKKHRVQNTDSQHYSNYIKKINLLEKELEGFGLV